MNVRGGGDPPTNESGTSTTTSTSGGIPLACNEVRITNQAGGILECLTFSEACARGIVTDSSLCTTQLSSTTGQLSSVAQVSNPAVVSTTPATADFGSCVSCGGFLALLIISDALLGTNLIIRRKKA